jgi:DNA gyrase subunit A
MTTSPDLQSPIQPEPPAPAGRVRQIPITEELKSSYLDYAMSVIVGRALPDVRDGLKPVHRRILYSMLESGSLPDKPHRKSARIVGDVMGRYHPHGDAAIYDTIVRMVQTFSLRYPLIDGQGNFGSIDGDSAAAMRYTEVRMAKIAKELLEDINKETVDFVPNYDNSLKEPSVLPALLPNLLINGSTGIAVGMATNMPPHNLGEVVDGIIHVIDHPDATIPELMAHIRAPDFPTAAAITGLAGVKAAYTTGRGIVEMIARTEIETWNDRERIVVTELPYRVNKAKLVEDVADLVKDKKIEGISDLRDESDKDGIRVVVDVRKGANSQVILNQLYKHTQLKTTFGIINLVLVDGEPKVLSLKGLIQCYIDHRKEIIVRRSRYDLKKAEDRLHILDGLKIALDNIDAVIRLIRSSKTAETARDGLISNFGLSEVQAKAILEMQLRRLTGIEREKLEAEYATLEETIAFLREVLANPQKVLDLIKEELLAVKEKYADPRRTEILEAHEEFEDEDLIPSEDAIITISNTGYIKRVPLNTYRQQGRGGRGVIGMGTKEEDVVLDIFIANTHDYILFFTDKGRVHWLKVYRIPEGSRQSKGKAIVNLLELSGDESVTAFVRVSEFDDAHYLAMATKRGIVKRTPLSEFSRPRKGGIIALRLDEGDELVSVRMVDDCDDIIIGTAHAKAIRFHAPDVRSMGRTARGVRGISLASNDYVVDMEIVEEGAALLTLTENGYGKRTQFDEYRVTRRGGKGIITIIPSLRNGLGIAIKSVCGDDELLVTSQNGNVIRIPVRDIRMQGRNTQGVRIMRLDPDDRAVAVARIGKLREGNEEGPDAGGEE